MSPWRGAHELSSDAVGGRLGRGAESDGADDGAGGASARVRADADGGDGVGDGPRGGAGQGHRGVGHFARGGAGAGGGGMERDGGAVSAGPMPARAGRRTSSTDTGRGGGDG